MIKRLAILHTVIFLADIFKVLLNENLPNLENFHIIDESILQELMRDGHLTPGIRRRIATQAMLARDAGADLILFTCSSTSPAVDTVRALVDVPILKADDPMAEKAVELGARIGVVVTARTTLEPSVSLIESHAAKQGRKVIVTSKLESQAFQAIMSGNREEHDRKVKDAAFELAGGNDVVVLAQASMAHLAEELKECLPVPVLVSPELCMNTLKKLCTE